VFLLVGRTTFFRELEAHVGEQVLARHEVRAEELRMRECLESVPSPPDEAAAGKCVEEGK
jgi:hypothetical protein